MIFKNFLGKKSQKFAPEEVKFKNRIFQFLITHTYMNIHNNTNRKNFVTRGNEET